MVLSLMKLSYLLFIFHFGINAIPIPNSKSTTDHRVLNPLQKSVFSGDHSSKLSITSNLSILLSKFRIPKNFNVSKVAKDLKDFGIHSLKDDHHIEGLPLDRHGKVNPEFHKEIFLGNHELFESDIRHDEQKRNKKLEQIFNEADVDHNERLSRNELVDYLFKNVQKHLKEAKDKNLQLFLLIDTNEDGKITWPEYVAIYTKLHNKNTTDIKGFNDVNAIPESLDLDLQHELLRIRYRWTAADTSDDSSLNIDEFLAFRHPEITSNKYKFIADDIILQMDQNGDEKINETEFVYMPTRFSGNDTNEWTDLDKKWIAVQQKEFRQFDQDGNGLLTREELMKAYDPINRVHMNIEVKRLFSQVDDSPMDDTLSFDEVKKHADIFTDLRMFDAGRVLHDEM